ncbi:hypothetical protein QTP88_009134 [Uroleucon formosanum]
MSNLKKHIERIHPLINLQPELNNEINQPSTSNNAQVTNLALQSMPIVIQHQVNPSTSTVEENVDNPSSEFVDSSNRLINKKYQTTNTLLNYFPRKITNEGFKQFINLLNPAYNLPSRHKLSKTSLPSLMKSFLMKQK